MSVAWSWAFDTPFKWTKQVASYFGGTRQGMAISWPGHITDNGGVRSQFHHIIDIVPTILEATGIQAPQMVNGIPQKPIEGVSMAYTCDKANADAPSTRKTQYFEMFGKRALYHDGWVAATDPTRRHGNGLGKLPDVVDGYNWELYRSARTTRRTTISRRRSRTSCNNCRTCSWSRRRSTRCCRWTIRSSRGCSRRGRAPPPGATSSPTSANLTGIPTRRAEHS